MDKIEEVKEYLGKLNLLVTRNAEFSLIDAKLVKKTKVDDLLCCIIAVLPDKYKKFLKLKKENRLSSVVNYNAMLKVLTRPFFFNKNLYIVDYKKVSACINRIIVTIERDIAYLEKMS